jgi:cytochrome c oxidase cbb3-type subunit 4
MDINDFRSAVTVLAFVSFIGIVLWAYHAKSRRGLDDGSSGRPRAGSGH